MKKNSLNHLHIKICFVFQGVVFMQCKIDFAHIFGFSLHFYEQTPHHVDSQPVKKLIVEIFTSLYIDK